MTIPLKEPRMTDVRAEFGGFPATPLSAYLRGGAFVPVQTVAAIPTALPINLLAFAGAKMPPSVSYTGITPSNGFSVSSAIVASDLSTMTFVVARTKTDNGGQATNDLSQFQIGFSIAGGLTSPSVILRSRATVQDVNGYWKLTSADQLRVVASPAQLVPAIDYATYDHHWRINDTTNPYTGELQVTTPFPIVSQPTPPTRQLTVVGTTFSLQLSVPWSLSRGSAAPPGSAMSWNTRNGGANTYVEFPIALDVYDGATLVATYNSVLHFEINSTLNFNPS